MADGIVGASCLCGDVRWEVDLPIERLPRDESAAALLSLIVMSNCHCSRCRKAHGAPFATYVAAREKHFRLTQGHDRIVRYESSPGAFRPFCSRCGSVVPDGVAWQGRVGMPAGPFDADPGLRPRSHIFFASKAPWVDVHDDLPRFDAYPPGFDAPVVAEREPDEVSEGIGGSCLCNAVAYVVTGEKLRCRSCHCMRCRKAYSSTYYSGLLTSLDGLRFTRGEDQLVRFKVPDARYFATNFCRVCGSKMPRRDPERNISIIPMGTLDDDPGIRPNMHIFVGSKAPWDVIADGLPQHEESSPL